MPREIYGETVTSRRGMLATSALGLAVAATPSCAQTSAPPPAVRPTAGEGASARAFGAIGDGQFHPLSSRFATLDQARAVYPFVERLDQSIDWAGIQAAINSVEAASGTATIPIGRFVISDSIKLPSSVTLRGEARNGSVLDNQYHPLAVPQVVNKDDVAFLYATIRDLTLNGGTHAIKIRATREVAGIVIEGLTTNLQSEANITFSSMQTTVIRDCHLMDGKHGVSVDGFPCNSVHLINTRLGRHSDASVRLRGADGFVMVGGSMEAGGAPGRGTIDIETGGAYANAVHFQNVYFENTHEHLLRSRGAGTVAFHGCKMTGTGARGAGMAAYGFDCGNDLIVFGDNHWDLVTQGPANMLTEGRNDRLGGAGTQWFQRSGRAARLLSRRFTPAEAGSGLVAIAFEEQDARACGELELFFDMGPAHPIRRLVLPVDIASSATGVISASSPGTGGGRLTTLPAAKGARIGINTVDVPAGWHRLWFRLDLSSAPASTMTVNVL